MRQLIALQEKTMDSDRRMVVVSYRFGRCLV